MLRLRSVAFPRSDRGVTMTFARQVTSPMGYTEIMGLRIERANCLQWCSQLWPQSQDRLRRKLLAYRHTYRSPARFHRIPAHTVLLCQSVPLARCGGLRKGPTFAKTSVNRWHDTSTWRSSPKSIVLSPKTGGHACRRKTRPALLFEQACCVSKRRLALLRSAAAP